MCNCLAIFPEISLFKWICCINQLQNIFDHWINSFPSCFQVFIDIGDCLLITTTASSYSVLLIHVSWHSPQRQSRPISSNYFCNWICSLFLGEFFSRNCLFAGLLCLCVPVLSRQNMPGLFSLFSLIFQSLPSVIYLLLPAEAAPNRVNASANRVEEIN